jgi:hypothetical protein
MEVQRGRLVGTVRVASLEFENPHVELQGGFPFANLGARFLEGLVLVLDPAAARLWLGRDAAEAPGAGT